MRGWTEVINAVAPPIAAHEVLEVTLSHDMIGFDGVADVTFRVLSRVMEESQVLSKGTEQQLIVNQARHDKVQPTSAQVEATKPMTAESTPDEGEERDVKAVNGFEDGWKLTESSLSSLIASHEPVAPRPSNVTVPVTHCPVFVRIQPVTAALPGSSLAFKSSSTAEQQHLYFLLALQDPSHGLSHKTCSQSFPASWRKYT